MRYRSSIEGKVLPWALQGALLLQMVWTHGRPIIAAGCPLYTHLGVT